ncbi:CLUMA_CG000214, isoform A [Clunio marinus]|uniref:CLUMA_CG000214, isoform A n=1 Tax=Clunio marinus TaxID=568069 RepID=A0A1J1HEH2_9DIPT|nr:CLUMA_CG000214, isoform A [Clunio marinus]
MQFCSRSSFNNRRMSYGYFGMIFVKPQIRLFTSSQLQTALRPFFFMVHPDLFGKFPEQRAINENSLQVLSAHLENLQRRSFAPQSGPTNLPFYLRDKDKSKPFRLVKVPLTQQRDTKNFVVNVLKICGLETVSVEKIAATPPSPKKSSGGFKSSGLKYTVDDNEGQFSEEFDLFQFKVRRAREDETLAKFIKKNIDLAQIRTKNLEELREEVQKLKIELETKLMLIEIKYNCGWNFEHFRGCLKSLEKLHDLYADDMYNLKKKTIIFSQFTGVSLDGDIHLFTGDVQNNWLDLIKNIPQQEVYLSTIPMYENTLSQVLRDIQIARRKFMPKTLAKNYSSHLSKVITNVLDFLGKNKFPTSWPESLRDYELVVESESGPLMVSPTGQLIAPSSCPGFLLIDFFTKNLEEATIRQAAYKKNKYIERDLHKECIEKLKAQTILKDDNITPDLMIDCMKKLLETDMNFSNLNLHVTTYYSILSDGTVCIPWNFK